ncbi:hypothetical protein SEA_ZEPP_48 [Microbacterium phage Zepp]|nr:hypothetical protein SEA_ZEPP_48 [Microbacterium phage Zepp]
MSCRPRHLPLVAGAGHTQGAAMRIHLNGGPMHDQLVDVPDDRNHFHILESPADAIQRAIRDMTEPPSPEQGLQRLPLREGMYSQVRHYPGEFEWDGWRSHD